MASNIGSQSNYNTKITPAAARAACAIILYSGDSGDSGDSGWLILNSIKKYRLSLQGQVPTP